MSGICAIWRHDDAGPVSGPLASIAVGLRLGGEERAVYEINGPAGLGISSSFATQQIYRNGRVVLACDADLINEAELRKSGNLETADKNAPTAALLAALYDRCGCDFVEKLRGNFSLILWDIREQKMLAAVDGFGVNRLVYYQDGKILLVASRTGALIASGMVDPDVNPRAIANVLNFGSNLAPETIFSRVKRLSPGHLLMASARHTHASKYWDMRYGIEGDTNENRLASELEAVVERSVAAHANDGSFGELGAFLSGGTDSSTVVGMMSRLGRGPVKAFSIGFEEQAFNELGYAETTASKFKAEHYTYLVSAQDCFDALPGIIRSFDEPFGNPSAIPTYFCAKLATQHGVKTLLAGDGGDELFGGNQRYATDQIFQIYHSVPGVFRKGLIEPAAAILPERIGLVRRARGYIRRANMPGPERYLSYHFLRSHPLDEIFEPGFLKALGEYSVVDIPARYYEETSGSDHLDRLLYIDVKITLGDSDLPKVTCTSELAGIQTRFPFLDRSVAMFSGRIPARLKVKGFNKRYLFKKAFRNLLPAEVIRKKKHGFGIPVSTWFKTDRPLRELAHDILLSARTLERGYLRRVFMEDLFRKYEADNTTYYGDMIWIFLVVELWHRQYVDQVAGIAL